jgi:hypothetical protein
MMEIPATTLTGCHSRHTHKAIGSAVIIHTKRRGSRANGPLMDSISSRLPHSLDYLIDSLVSAI